jgi:hypothetical protein
MWGDCRYVKPCPKCCLFIPFSYCTSVFLYIYERGSEGCGAIAGMNVSICLYMSIYVYMSIYASASASAHA